MNLNYNSYEKDEIKEKFIYELKNIFYKEKKKRNYLELVFLCIGTDRMTGDCFGPLVGTKLQKSLEQYNIFNINIYGSLDKNISYTNIQEIVKKIKKLHPNAYIIVIDAALSQKENIGKIFVKEEKISLGKGLNKNRIEVGDTSIRAVVGKNYKIPNYNFTVLQNISLNVVLRLADIVSDGIIEVIKYI